MFDQTQDFHPDHGPAEMTDALAGPAFRTPSGGIDYARAVQAGRVERSLAAHRAVARLAAALCRLAGR